MCLREHELSSFQKYFFHLLPGLRVSCMRHRYDFYKPVMSSIFPKVDGHLSVSCYREAVQSCYRLYREKVKKITGESMQSECNSGLCFKNLLHCGLASNCSRDARNRCLKFGLQTRMIKLNQKYVLSD